MKRVLPLFLASAYLIAPFDLHTKGMSVDEVDTQVADTQNFEDTNNGEYKDPTELKDPLEPLNRFVFGVNDRVDGAILRPVAQVYDDVTPKPIKDGVTNFMDNLWFPINFVNFLLQGRMEQAGLNLCRFILNSTMGVGGVLDPAAEFGLEKENTGFGDTLGSWGVEAGPYLMLPLFGPSSFRGAIGFVTDYTLHPLAVWARNKKVHHHVNKHHQWWHWYVGKQSLEFINIRAQFLKTFDDLQKNSLDDYIAIRSLYGQKIHAAQEKIKSDREKIMMDDDSTAPNAVPTLQKQENSVNESH